MMRREHLSALLITVLAGCAAADPPSSKKKSLGSDTLAAQTAEAEAAVGAKISFQAFDFYSLSSPNPTSSCAGDAKIFYEPFDLDDEGLPAPMSNDILTSDDSTIRPSFIKNAAVDLTDSSSSLAQNAAKSCSLTTSIIPTSNCATFDSGTVAGISSTLGGNLVLVGGVSTQNFAGPFVLDDGDLVSGVSGVTSGTGSLLSHTVGCGPSVPSSSITSGSAIAKTGCPSQIYALALDTISPTAAFREGASGLAPGMDEDTAAGAMISSWGNLTPLDSALTAPRGIAGAAAAFSPTLSQLALFGGSSPITADNTLGNSAYTRDLWVFDIKTQTWARQASGSVAAGTTVTSLLDTNPTDSVTVTLPKNIGGRSLFGIAAVGGMALASIRADGGADIDITQRIMTVGGKNNAANNTYLRKFNPTFGPDLKSRRSDDQTVLAGGATSAVQWLDVNPTQLAANDRSTETSLTADYVIGTNEERSFSPFRPHFLQSGSTLTTTNQGNFAHAFGMAAIQPDPTSTTNISTLLTLGGFTPSVTNNFSHNTQVTTSANGLGSMQFITKRVDNDTDFEEVIASMTPNEVDGTRARSALWAGIADGGAANQKAPWLGGMAVFQGLCPKAGEVIAVGGTSCLNFLTDSSASGCVFDNPGYMYSFDPALLLQDDLDDDLDPAEISDYTSTTAIAGDADPIAAGMASARGTNVEGTKGIALTWGGRIAINTSANPATVNVLFDNGGTCLAPATPTWEAVTSTSAPANLTYASMVFSHVTRKFYVFGGYQHTGTVGAQSAIYELTISGTTAATFAASWKQLTPTCTPNCPAARFGHGMVEAAYHIPAMNAAREHPDCSDRNAPCSFGIFMESGQNESNVFFADRWMFDPTANGGQGHWSQVDDFPQRTLAAMTTVTYKPLGSSNSVTKAIVFGGEAGLASPNMVNVGATGTMPQYFAPPTFGDTLSFDLGSNSWSRMELFGKSYLSSAAILALTNELERRQAFIVTGGAFERQTTYSTADGTPDTLVDHTNELSPPPLSGAMMVTRTMSASVQTSATTVSPLTIPEVFLIGGRRKDGRFQALDKIYKLCVASPGETIFGAAGATDNAQCDHFDTVNTGSPAPLNVNAGRWHRKDPDGANFTSDEVFSFLGAATYNSYADRVVVFGGLTDADPADANPVALTSETTTPMRAASNALYEYTPPSATGAAATATELNGSWRMIASCTFTPADTTAPTARYGHSLSYDASTDQYIVVGGYDINGALLTTTYDSPAASITSYTGPEVWVAKRVVKPGTVSVTDSRVVAGAPSTTAPCLAWKKRTIFGNTPDVSSIAPPLTGLAHAAAVFVPSTGARTGYYTMNDSSCGGSGPFFQNDPVFGKQLAGGAYFDIDRSKLGTRENLVLNLTYLALGPEFQRTDGGTFTASDSAVIKIHLIRSNQALAKILAATQPRYVTYASADQFPQIVKSLSVMATPDGSPRQDQIFIPLTIDPTIDRIRIERVSGSAILIEAGLYRLGGS